MTFIENDKRNSNEDNVNNILYDIKKFNYIVILFAFRKLCQLATFLVYGL